MGRPKTNTVTVATTTDMNTQLQRNPVYRETTERFLFVRLITEVRSDGVYVRLAPFQRSFRHIPRDEIESVDTTTYSATAYRGWHWGIRKSLNRDALYRLRGDQGIELTLNRGRKLFIGSQSPSELQTAILRAKNRS